MLSRLSNYLRANRKRLGLSQEEVSFLLGVVSSSKVSRYERFARDPSLETALAFEAILQRPVRELFPGLYQNVQEKVAARAKVLLYKTNRQQPHRSTQRKQRTLAAIVEHNLRKKPRKT